MYKLLTIIITTFQSESTIKTCLENIDFNKYGVFVVDNNSSDNTVKIIEDQFPKVNLIKLEQNIGYGRANNIALKKTKTPYALILNPDAIISDDDIKKILNLLESDKKIAIASAMMYYCVLKDNEITDVTFVEYCLATLKEETKEAYFTRFVSGAGMFLNMSIFRKIGFFDENFFLYCEDNEICKRSRLPNFSNNNG